MNINGIDSPIHQDHPVYEYQDSPEGRGGGSFTPKLEGNVEMEGEVFGYEIEEEEVRQVRGGGGIDEGGPQDEHRVYRVTSPSQVIGAELGHHIGIDDEISEDGHLVLPKPLEVETTSTTPLLSDTDADVNTEDFHFLGLQTDASFESFKSLNEGSQEDDLQDTFMHMEYRKVKRLTSGKLREDPRSWIWGITYTCIMIAYLVAKYITYSSCDDSESIALGSQYSHWWQDPVQQDLAKEIILVMLLGICLVSVTDNFQSLATSLTVLSLYILVVMFFLLGDTTGCEYVSDEAVNGGLELFGIWIFSVVVIWSIHFFYFVIAPFVVKHTRMCFGWRRLRSVSIPAVNGRLGDNGESLKSSLRDLPRHDPRVPQMSKERGERERERERDGSRTPDGLGVGGEKRPPRPRSVSVENRRYTPEEEPWWFSPTKWRQNLYGSSERVVSGDRESSGSANVREVVFQYRPLAKRCGFFCWSMSRHTFLYRGAMKNGRPDGWGQWRDDSFHGESVAGYWQNGIPVGPFNSCEKGTGNMFSAVMIGYCSMRTKNWQCLPQDECSDTLTYGLVSVECSISGDYYQNFPNLIVPRDMQWECICCRQILSNDRHPDCSQVSHMLPHFRHSQSNQQLSSVVVTASGDGELSITGHHPNVGQGNLAEIAIADASPSPEKSPVKATITQSEETKMPRLRVRNWHDRRGNEAVIFLHGYNIPMDWALKKFAQMLTGGGYPSYIKPFLFSWPTGKLMFYPKAIEMCEDERTAIAFTHYLRSLKQAGFEAIHILSHSMGIRMFLSALSRPEVQDLFQSKVHKDDAHRMQLASVIFANPDYGLKKFRDEDYEYMRNFCSLITIYSDQGDTALKYSAIYAGAPSLGSLRGPLLAANKRALDLDVIDTTDLQDNMHAVRHSAFNVNRIILEDMREVIVQRRRAVYRSSRLVKKQGNFFVFMTIPSMVDGNVV